jgi:group I intron endonuclease
MPTQIARSLQTVCLNPPLKRAGAYIIEHADTGRVYVGISDNLYRRFLDHNRGNHGIKLRRAIAKYGASAFVFRPIFYIVKLSGRTELLELEADLIRSLNACKNGFNTVESSLPGSPYGEEHAARCREAANRPEIRKRKQEWMSERYNTPEGRAEQSKRQKAHLAQPGAVARRIKNMRRDDVEVEQKRKAAAKAATQTAEFKKTMAKTRAILAADPQWRARNSAAKKMELQDPIKRAKRIAQIRALNADSEIIRKKTEKLKATLATPKVRAKRSEAAKKVWAKRKAEGAEEWIKKRSEARSAAMKARLAKQKAEGTPP